jgi:hypothetical protein
MVSHGLGLDVGFNRQSFDDDEGNIVGRPAIAAEFCEPSQDRGDDFFRALCSGSCDRLAESRFAELLAVTEL